MRRLASASVILVALAALLAAPAIGQTTILDQAASRLRSDPVYVDPEADVADDVDADGLRQRIRASNAPIFVAVLPASAIDEGGGDAGRLPSTLATRTGLTGTYGVVAGRSFRGGSNSLAPGQGGALATAAFQAHRDDGIQAILEDFVERVSQAQAARGPQATVEPSGSGPARPSTRAGAKPPPATRTAAVRASCPCSSWPGRPAAGSGTSGARSRGSGRTTSATATSSRPSWPCWPTTWSTSGPRSTSIPTPAPTTRRRCRATGWPRRRCAATDQPIDLVRVGRLLDEAQYAMARAKAITEGREPPPPPSDLSQPGRRGEPPVDLDERGQPAYVGGGSPFYGGGWFGGGGGLMTGLFLGQMLGGGWGWGGGHDTNVYVDNDGDGDGGGGDAGDTDAGGGDWGGGDWGGGVGGGDFGGGDWGGGDIGGGDF